jgi:hypothetical protein
MLRTACLTLVALAALAVPASAAGISGQYLEARTCDVWTGPCFANAELNIGGKNAVMGWKVEHGTFDNVTLDGLSIVAVVAARDTLGIEQTGPAKALLIVDKKANSAQRAALIAFAKKQAGELLQHVIRVEDSKIDLEVMDCKEGGCARLEAGKAKIETRCLNQRHDKVCGNESAYYPPLCKDVKATPAMAVEHSFVGECFKETWKDSQRRGAYIGSFELRQEIARK